MIVLEGNGQRESHKGDGYKESETMYTLNTVEQHGVCYSQDRFDKYTENDKSPSLLSSGGMYGGGARHLLYQETVGTLCSSDEKGVGNQYVQDGKVIIQRNSNRESSE